MQQNYTYKQKTNNYCNICGKPLNDFDLHEDLSIKKERLGYGTVHDGDGLNLSICCACLDALVERCTISPIIHNDDTNPLWFSM